MSRPLPRKRLVGVERALEALAAEARAWSARAASLEAAVAAMREQVAAAARARASDVPVPRRSRRRPGGAAAAGVARRAARGRGAGAIAVEVLREWGRPARVNDLLDELERRGVAVGGKRPYATLAATLMKLRGVRRAGRGLFAATGQRR